MTIAVIVMIIITMTPHFGKIMFSLNGRPCIPWGFDASWCLVLSFGLATWPVVFSSCTYTMLPVVSLLAGRPWGLTPEEEGGCEAGPDFHWWLEYIGVVTATVCWSPGSLSRKVNWNCWNCNLLVDVMWCPVMSHQFNLKKNGFASTWKVIF